MNKNHIYFASITSLLLLLAGCGAQVSENASDKEDFPVGGKVYATVEELWDDYVSAGGECPQLDLDAEPTLGSTSSGTCRLTDDTIIWATTLTVFPNSSLRDGLIEVQDLVRNMDELDGTSRIVGSNWLINDPTDGKVLLGGVLQTGTH